MKKRAQVSEKLMCVTHIDVCLDCDGVSLATYEAGFKQETKKN